MFKFTIVFLLFSKIAFAQLPAQPTDPVHPGSAAYPFTVKQENFQANGRRVDVYLPAEAKQRGLKVPVIIFGHGQAIDVQGYDLTFKHFAQKGIAVIHPMFDSGFFDQDWRRMAKDFNQLTQSTLRKYSDSIDDQKVIYAGHSKGGYIALMAAGEPGNAVQVKSVVLFAPAGFDAEYLKNMPSKLPVTLIWGDDDGVIKQSSITEIYAKLPSQFKQWIEVKSYDKLKAGHFFPLTRSYFFGGQNGTNALHYFATWKWLLGAAMDVNEGGNLKNIYLYGNQTSDTGVAGQNHKVTRSW